MKNAFRNVVRDLSCHGLLLCSDNKNDVIRNPGTGFMYVIIIIIFRVTRCTLEPRPRDDNRNLSRPIVSNTLFNRYFVYLKKKPRKKGAACSFNGVFIKHSLGLSKRSDCTTGRVNLRNAIGILAGGIRWAITRARAVKPLMYLL